MRFLKLFILAFSLFWCTGVCSATTHYIRTDGGTSAQCKGTTNAPLAGATSNNCALSNPYYLVTDNTTSTAFTWSFVNTFGVGVVSGDTIQFEDAGPYYIGLKLGSGPGTTWLACGTDGADCVPPPQPSGVAFKGLGAGACHNSGHTVLVNPTQFVGINNIFWMWSLESAADADFECFDFTQPSMCTLSGIGGVPAGTFTGGSISGGVLFLTGVSNSASNAVTANNAFMLHGLTGPGAVLNGQWITVSATGLTSTTMQASTSLGNVTSIGSGNFGINCTNGTDNYAQHGVVFQSPNTTNQGPIRLTFKDFQAHGLANEAISGQKFNSSSGDVTNISDVYLLGNANSNWDGDTGTCGATGCLATGTINIHYVSALWAGCMEIKPNGGTIGGNGVNTCVDQGFNGNGDNVVMVATNGTWNWDHLTIKWGFQDGFDGIHMGDNPTTTVVVNLTNSWSEGNEGQQYKFGGNVDAYNLVGVTNCRRFSLSLPGGQYAFAPNPVSYNLYANQSCRAFSGVKLQVSNGNYLKFTNSTLVGYANPVFDIECNLGDTTNCPANTYTVDVRDNLVLAYNDPVTSTDPGGLFWGTATNPFANTGSLVAYNLWFGAAASSGGGTCPQETTYETHDQCGSPLLVGQSSLNTVTLDGVNPNLTSSSPAIGAGIMISGITTDCNGNTRPNPPAIGACEYASSVASPSNFTGYFTLYSTGTIQ